MPVTVISNAINGMIPTSIYLNIYYHQKSTTIKKIITASVSFENYVLPTDSQYNKTSSFYYNLYFSYIPLTHTDLTIMFALDWQVYLVLYFGVGIMAITIVGIFLLYHILMEK